MKQIDGLFPAARVAIERTPPGIHEIEWRYETYNYGGQPGDSAWIDDVVFTGQ